MSVLEEEVEAMKRCKSPLMVLAVVLTLASLLVALAATTVWAARPPTATVYVPSAASVGAANANPHQDAVELVPLTPF